MSHAIRRSTSISCHAVYMANPTRPLEPISNVRNNWYPAVAMRPVDAHWTHCQRLLLNERNSGSRFLMKAPVLGFSSQVFCAQGRLLVAKMK